MNRKVNNAKKMINFQNPYQRNSKTILKPNKASFSKIKTLNTYSTNLIITLFFTKSVSFI